jgi:TetR/AcrR family transcriptional repressor of nem operon
VTIRRTQILDAAAALITERGFQRTSVDDLIECAGLSGKSHFYHYFKSKEELGYEVLGRQFDLVAEKGMKILRESNLEPMDRLNVFIDSIVAVYAEKETRCGSPFGLLATEMAEKDEGFRLRIAQVFRGWISQLQSLFEEMGDQLTEDAEPQRLARFIIATLEGATQMARMKRDVSIIHGVAVDLKRFIAGHVRQPTPR